MTASPSAALSSSGATPGPAARSEAAGYHRLLTEHPALALTLGYLLISLARFTTAGFNRYLPAAFFIGYSVMFIWVYAGKRADELKAGIGHGIRLEVAEGQARRPSPGSPTLMMGTSARFVFLYRPDDDLVEIVPHENILRLVIEAPPAAQPPAAPAPTRRTEP